MPQTFYIENDEEIISIIGRLRKSSAEENYFVFPKRALVLQSIVNLRLLLREAQKLGKKIVIVTQDEDGKRLAEKAGLDTESYSDDFSARANHVEIERTQPIEKKPMPVPSMVAIPRSQDLGSTDFYAPQSIAPSVPNEAQGMSLRIRNASPAKQTSLNSMRPENQNVPEKSTVPTPAFHPSVSMGPAPSPVVSSDQRFAAPKQPILPQPAPNMSPQAPSVSQNVPSNREERLKNFFAPKDEQERRERLQSRPVAQVPKAAPQKTAPTVSKKAHHVFLILGGISLLSLLGVGLFLFLPKAEVHIVPHKLMRSADVQFDCKNIGDMSGENALPVRIIESEQPVSLSLQATGTAPGSAQKARGSVVISNEFSTDPQTLVATTRFESAEGKIFRLIEGVTVPGMSAGQPGTVTAAVIADQTGSDYNISPTSFTIPGFKGSPKFAKFSAKSTKAMSGGGDATGGDITVISKADLDKAEKDAKEKAKEDYMSAVDSQLMSDEKVLEEVMEITPENQAALPVAGTAGSSFEYQNTYKVRAFIFSEKAVKEKIAAQMNQKVSDIEFQPKDITLTYGESIPNYTDGTLRLKTHAAVTLESVIDRDTLVDELLGKDEQEINTLLDSHPEIKKIQIEIKPQWFSTVIPKSKDRVIVTIEPGEE